jgi:hypothetical protein
VSAASETVPERKTDPIEIFGIFLDPSHAGIPVRHPEIIRKLYVFTLFELVGSVDTDPGVAHIDTHTKKNIACGV